MPWVWAAAEQAEMTTLHADLSPSTVAFINGGSGNRLWGRAYSAEPSIEERAAAEFAATALAAVRVATDAGAATGRMVAVLGDGIMAELIRTSLPEHVLAAPDACGDAAVIVDTTGLAEELRRAVTVLPRLGQLVLAAPPNVRDIEMATYKNIHVPGLSIVGVPWSYALDAVDTAPLAEVVLAGIGRATLGHPTGRCSLYALSAQVGA